MRSRKAVRRSTGVWVCVCTFAVLALAVSACEPTKGSNPDAFQEQPTNNFDFLAPQFIPVGIQPTSAAVASPSGSGCASNSTTQRPLAAVANFIDNTVSIIGFDTTTSAASVISTQATGFAPTRIVFGDLDHSGATSTGSGAPSNGACAFDMVAMLVENIAGDGDGFTILQTTNNVTWNRQDISLGGGNTPAEIALQDMNNDGWVDLVVSVPASSQLLIYLNQKSGSTPIFNSTPDVAVSLTGSPGRFVVQQGFAGANLNLDGDSCTDIVVLVPGLNVINTLSSNNGTLCAPFSGGSYAVASFGVDVNPVDLAAADLNGDGSADLMVLTAGDAPPRVDFLVGPSFSPFANTPIEIRSAPALMAAQVYDGVAADIGVVTANTTDQSVSTVYTTGSATAFPNTYYAAKGNPFDVAAAHIISTDTTRYDIAVSDNRKRVLYIGHNDTFGNFSFSQIGFENAPGGPDIGFISGTQTYHDILLTQKLNNMLVFLQNGKN